MIVRSNLRKSIVASMKRIVIGFCMVSFIALNFFAWTDEKHNSNPPAQVSQEQKSSQQDEKSSTPSKEHVSLEKSGNEGEPIRKSQSPKKKIPAFWILLPER